MNFGVVLSCIIIMQQIEILFLKKLWVESKKKDIYNKNVKEIDVNNSSLQLIQKEFFFSFDHGKYSN